MLLEALLGILIFTIGIIGLMGMQTAATRATADLKYRSEASLYAEQLINQMWADNHATLAANYATGGTKYTDWKNQITAAGTGLPGSGGANAPTVAVVQGTTGALGGAIVAPTPTVVTITIRWQGPGDAAAHRYVTTTSLPPT